MKHMLFFGNSLTAGYGLADAVTESFPALIGQKIREAGLDYKITNAGVSGDTTSNGLQRLDYWLSGQIDVFVLELGVNDAIRRVPPITIKQNLRAIIGKVKHKHPAVKIALMGMPIGTIYQELADEFGLAFVPFFLAGVAGKRSLNLRDGLHPSAAGYRVITENVWPILKTIL